MNDEILTVTCPCGNPMKVRASSIGKKVRCPQCQAVTTIARPESLDPETPAAEPSDSAPEPEPAPPNNPTKIEVTPKPNVAKPKATKPLAAKPKPAQPQPTEPPAVVAEPKPAERKKPKRKSAEAKEPVLIPDLAISEPPVKAPDFSALSIVENDSPVASDGVPVIPEIKTDAPTPVSSARDTTPEIELDESKPAKKVASGKRKQQVSDSETVPTLDEATSNEIKPQVRASQATTHGGSGTHASPRTYPTLEWIGKLYKVLGVLWLVLAGIASLLPLISITQGASLLLILPSVLGGLCVAVLGAVTLFAAAELIRVVLDIQDNTHRSSLR